MKVLLLLLSVLLLAALSGCTDPAPAGVQQMKADPVKKKDGC